LQAIQAIRSDPFLSGRQPGRDGKPFCLDIDRLLSTESGLGDVLARLLDAATKAAAPAQAQHWWLIPDKVASVDDDGWRHLIRKHAQGPTWPVNHLGPPPDTPRCVVPRHIIAEMRLCDVFDPNGIRRRDAPLLDWMQAAVTQ